MSLVFEWDQNKSDKNEKNMALLSRKPKPFSTIDMQLLLMILITQMTNTAILILGFPLKVEF